MDRKYYNMVRIYKVKTLFTEFKLDFSRTLHITLQNNSKDCNDNTYIVDLH